MERCDQSTWERLGAAIRRERTARGVSGAQLVKIVRGTPRAATAAEWESGARHPSLEDVILIEQALSLPRGYLLRSANLIEDGTTVTEVISAAPELDEFQKRALLAVYRSLISEE